jgi:outer membrane protein assembly factor BamB
VSDGAPRRRHPTRHFSARAGVLILAVALLAGCSSQPARPSAVHRARPSTTTTTSASSTTTTSAGQPVPDLRQVAWRAGLDGAVFAQPVIAGSRAFVATEADNVYALDLATGRILWKANIGNPLTDVVQRAGCGNIDPLGITSTPVADVATNTLYVVGETSNAAGPGTVERRLVGFDMSTGRVVRTADADPTGGGDDQIDLLQRPALVLDAGRVDVGFGGLYGDCGYYHGWVVGVSTTPGVPNIEFDATAGGSGGAIWQSGAPPSIDAAGNLFVGTGNENSQGTAGYYESVVKLSPGLVPRASFRDTRATGDLDLGTGAPMLLPDGNVFAVGKTEIGYVLRQSDLGLVARIPGVCGSDPDGREALDTVHDTVFVPCAGGGIQEVHLASDSLGWRAGQVNSSPVLADGVLWALAYPDGLLQALDPSTGRVLQSTNVGPVAHFATPALSGSTLVVATQSGQVVAFTGQ